MQPGPTSEDAKAIEPQRDFTSRGVPVQLDLCSGSLALSPETEMFGVGNDVCFVPEADILAQAATFCQNYQTRPLNNATNVK